MTYNHRDILGSGLDFPVAFKQGKLTTAGGVESVYAALRMLFVTPTGTRFFLPEYGCDLHRLLFEPLNETTAQLARVFAQEAVLTWIPRISRVHLEARINYEQGSIELHVYFWLLNHPTEESFIWPFYLDGRDFANV